MKKNVALVLSSGGAKGLAHIGVIQELQAQGYSISSISGASIGSLIGGLYAINKLDEFTDYVSSLTIDDVINMIDLTLSSRGFIKAERLFRHIENIIPDTLIEEMNIPLAIIATDISNRKEKVITKGSFYQAVRASIAIPAIVTSVRESDQILVDGGVMNPIPINHLHRQENDIVVAVNLYGYPKENDHNYNEKSISNSIKNDTNFLHFAYNRLKSIKSVKNNIFENLAHSSGNSYGYISTLGIVTSLMVQRISALSLELGKPEMIVSIPIDAAGTFDFHKAQSLIKLGREISAKTIMDYETNMSSQVQPRV